MNTMMSITLPLVLLLVGQTVGNFITVSNGGNLGEWGALDTCPLGTVATGFALKVEQNKLLGDDTALNGISLLCESLPVHNRKTFINSTVGQWGRWGKTLQCKRGWLSGFALRVEEYLVLRDNTAANNIKFVCSDGNTIEGYGLRYGTYGIWSEKCKTGICGIQTQVQENQGPLDDTSLNNVRFLCCKNSPKGEDDQQQQTQ